MTIKSGFISAELLAPAGGWDCVRAAVANGADAVYFGLPKFNARLRADNFTEAELPEVVEFCHRHGVKAYVALNTLIFTAELDEAAEYLRLLSRSGVDALIVQDVGLVRLARVIVPQLPIHASTQMTITSPEGVEFAQGLGVERAVLAREVSLQEIGKFKGGEMGLPLEVFVHGALCVAYSGPMSWWWMERFAIWVIAVTCCRRRTWRRSKKFLRCWRWGWSALKSRGD